MTNKIVVFLVFLLLIEINAQTVLEGIVKNDDNEPLTYCSIGIKGSAIGTITNNQGFYSLIIPDELKDKAVVFNAEGYFENHKSVADLKLNGNIYLKYKIFNISEVTFKAKKLKKQIVGQKSKPMLTFSRMFDKNVPTVEQGNIFDIYKKTRIESFNFHIIPSSKYKQITLKLNIYDVRNNLPNQSLLQEKIIYNSTTTGWQNIDLSKYKLVFNNLDKIAITLQLVDYIPLENNDFIFGISAKKTLTKDLLFRYQSQSAWEQSSGTFLSNINIVYDEKGDANIKVDDIAQADASEKEKKIISFYKGREEGLKSIYGKNPGGKWISLPDAKIYYEEYGQGEPLILLQGNNGLISDFYNQIPFLSKHYRIIAIDTRGQGKSLDFAEEDYSYEKFADDLLAIVKQLKLEKVNIVGLSDGGITGLTFNYKYPDDVKKLVVLGANLHPDGVNDEVLNSIKETFEKSQDHKERRRLNLMISYPNITKEDLKNIKNPVLVLAGDNDDVKEAHTEQIAEMLENSELEIIQNSSHHIPFDQPKILNNRILKFLWK